MPENDDDDSDKVGYRKPPRNRQFKPGKSGNTGQRPRRQRTVAQAIAMALNHPVKVKQGNRETTMSERELIIRTHIDLAMKGNFKSFKAILMLTQKLEIDVSESALAYLVVPATLTAQQWDRMARDKFGPEGVRMHVKNDWNWIINGVRSKKPEPHKS